MNQANYNAKVQELQMMWGPDACRIRRHHDWKNILKRATFEVYWDGHWHILGTQFDPFTNQTRYEWDEEKELKLRGAFAGELMHS